MNLVDFRLVKEVFPFAQILDVKVQEVEIKMSSEKGAVEKENPIPLVTVSYPKGGMAGIQYQQPEGISAEAVEIFYFDPSKVVKTYKVGEKIGENGPVFRGAKALFMGWE